jgi:hypothetical protein
MLVTQPPDAASRMSGHLAPTVAALAHPTPTTLSAMAGQVPSATVAPVAKKKTGVVLAALGVAVVGGIGAFVALNNSNSKSPETAAASPAPPPPASTGHSTTTVADPTPPPAPPAAPPAPPADERPAKTKAELANVVAAFVTWSAAHAGAPCPKVDEVTGRASVDGWGHPLVMTCTDQPADQIVGVVSSGPDGKAGTNDDIASWRLDRAVTDSIRGARWTAKPTTTSRPKTKRTTTKTKKSGTGVPGDLDGDGIPDSR